MTETTTSLPANVLEVRDLTIAATSGSKEVLHGVSFDLHPGKILSLVGESGSGKTTAGLACLGHFRTGLEHTGGAIEMAVKGEIVRILELAESERRSWRGGSISYVPQDPALSLNPAIRVGEQIHEVLRIHGFGSSQADRDRRVDEVLTEVGLPAGASYRRRFPHQLSGGQQQRIGIAMAFACRPEVIVLDEPTTGLDVTTQSLVLDTIGDLTRRHDVAGLYITHDLAVVADLADDVAVMLQGDIVETGTTKDVLYGPQHKYTRKLLRAVPDLAGKHKIGDVEAVTDEHPMVIERREEAAASGDDTALITADRVSLSYGSLTVLDGISLDLVAGESTMLLGESGSGKTTLSRCIAGLNDKYAGEVKLDGTTLRNGTRRRTAEQRRRIQYVFQSPFSSLNPRRTIGESVGVPLQMNGTTNTSERRKLVFAALDQVRLGSTFIDRRPGELSGGERQRAAIARALVNTPSVLVCDEITSALDVSVQASIIDLLRTLQVDTGMAMLFVTHNIALALHISQRLAVLQKGKIVDNGPTPDVLDNPQHEYTRQLLDHVPKF